MLLRNFVIRYNNYLIRYCIVSNHVWYDLLDMCRVLNVTKSDIHRMEISLRYNKVIQKILCTNRMYVKYDNIVNLARKCLSIGVFDVKFFVFMLNNDKSLKESIYTELVKHVSTNNSKHFVSIIDSYTDEKKVDIQLLTHSKNVVKLLCGFSDNVLCKNHEQVLHAINSYAKVLNADQKNTNERFDFWLIWHDLATEVEYNMYLKDEILLIQKRMEHISEIMKLKNRLRMNYLL